MGADLLESWFVKVGLVSRGCSNSRVVVAYGRCRGEHVALCAHR